MYSGDEYYGDDVASGLSYGSSPVVKDFGAGTFRVVRRYDWRTLERYYYATRSEARASLRAGDRLEWWNGEVWVI
jgi:hypothetical protein